MQLSVAALFLAPSDRLKDLKAREVPASRAFALPRVEFYVVVGVSFSWCSFTARIKSIAEATASLRLA